MVPLVGISAPDRKKETGRQDMSILSMYGNKKKKKKRKKKREEKTHHHK